jgi:hypothetical protein
MHTNDGRQNVPLTESRSGKVSLPQPCGRKERIKTLFLHRADSYPLRQAAEIVGVSPATLKREAERDRREEYIVGGRWRFTWRQLAYVAMRRWTLAEIHDALGPEAATVLPPLLTLRPITVRLPEYLLRAVETVAAEEGVTVDGWLHGELIDFAGTVARRMERVIPGFRRAYRFPGQE